MLNGAIPVRFSLITTLLVALLLASGLARLRGPMLAVGLVVYRRVRPATSGAPVR